ncbi:MAG: RNA polymerase sigma factor [Lachnospiraceae bacterium]|nr:RNA polymerase sigma factor [Lachnospiraceae bacterium]
MSQTGLISYLHFLRGEKNALEDLVRKYSDTLTRYAYCYVGDADLAEDVMEETFATLLVRHKHFDDEAHLQAYLYKVARNKSIDMLRKRKREVALSDVEEVLCGSDAESNVIKDNLNQQIYICMQQLPAQYKEVLYLSYFEDFSNDEVCSLMKKSKKQVYNLLSRARVALKEIFIKEGISYEDL